MCNKIILTIFILSITTFSFIYFQPGYRRCDFEQVVSINTPPLKSTFDAKVSIFIDSDGNHENNISYMGGITHGNKKYQVNRDVLFRYKKSKHKGIYHITIYKKLSRANDNVPDDVFFNYLPSPINTEFSVEVNKLNSNTLLVKGFNNPYFVCVY